MTSSDTNIDLRRAFGSFATGVVVVTSKDSESGSLIGLTINSFSSVSLSPPLISWALRDGSRRFCLFQIGTEFAINILSINQRDISIRFSASVGNRFEDLPYHLSNNGIPLIDGCVGFIECTVAKRYVAGDHDLILGQVEAWQINAPSDPLIFYRGNYLANKVVETGTLTGLALREASAFR